MGTGGIATNGRADQRVLSALLLEVRSLGSDDARRRVFEAVYGELRVIARALMREEREDHTLRPTALVHEAFVRMVEEPHLSWENRAHFFGIASRAMRQILVDHARERAALKRGGGRTRITLDDGALAGGAHAQEVLDLQVALDKLAAVDERSARVAEMHTFAGMGMVEIAEALGLSRRTVAQDWCFAKRWLNRELNGRTS